PLATNNSLVITRNQAIVTDGITILLSFQLPTEDPDHLQNYLPNYYTEPTIELPLSKKLTLSHKVDEPENIEEQDPEIEFEDPENPTYKTEKLNLLKLL
ncbi:18537_t:CDS:1, partial [Gigaspora rosea]